jgi:hypothetical protein
MKWFLTKVMCLHLLAVWGSQHTQGFRVAEPRAPLIVVRAASAEEKSAAKQLLELVGNPARLESQAKALGYKIIRNDDATYLLPPRCWRDTIYAKLSQLAEQLMLVSPRSPYPLSQCAPSVRSILEQWLNNQMNPLKPHEKSSVQSLLNSGHIWWSGFMSFEVEVEGQKHRGSLFLDVRPTTHPPALNQPQAPSQSSRLPESADLKASDETNTLEETLLFSREVPQQIRAMHARAYFEWVLHEHQESYKAYQQLLSRMESALLDHFRVDSALTTPEGCDFSVLPEWLQDQITQEIVGLFPNRSQDEVKSILMQGKVWANLLPVIQVGGFVSEFTFESYGWGLNDLVNIP